MGIFKNKKKNIVALLALFLLVVGFSVKAAYPDAFWRIFQSGRELQWLYGDESSPEVKARLDDEGRFKIGGSTPPTESAILTLESGDKALLIPKVDDLSVLVHKFQGSIIYDNQQGCFRWHGGVRYAPWEACLSVADTIPVLGSAPENPQTGMLYYDSTQKGLMVYDGNTFVYAGNATGSLVSSGRVVPGSGRDGQLFYHTDERRLYGYYRDTWKPIAAPLGGTYQKHCSNHYLEPGEKELRCPNDQFIGSFFFNPVSRIEDNLQSPEIKGVECCEFGFNQKQGVHWATEGWGTCQHVCRRTSRWIRNPYCPTSCGGGTQTRRVACLRTNSWKTIPAHRAYRFPYPFGVVGNKDYRADPGDCAHMPKPRTTRECLTHACGTDPVCPDPKLYWLGEDITLEWPTQPGAFGYSGSVTRYRYPSVDDDRGQGEAIAYQEETTYDVSSTHAIVGNFSQSLKAYNDADETTSTCPFMVRDVMPPAQSPVCANLGEIRHRFPLIQWAPVVDAETYDLELRMTSSRTSNNYQYNISDLTDSYHIIPEGTLSYSHSQQRTGNSAFYNYYRSRGLPIPIDYRYASYAYTLTAKDSGGQSLGSCNGSFRHVSKEGYHRRQ